MFDEFPYHHAAASDLYATWPVVRGDRRVPTLWQSCSFGIEYYISSLPVPLIAGSPNRFDLDRVFNWFQHFKISKKKK
jgi:hypothetical protein